MKSLRENRHQWVIAVTGLCAVVLALSSPQWAFPSDWMTTIALAAFCLLLSQLVISLSPAVFFLLNTSLVVAAYLLQGPVAAGVGMACSIPVMMYRRERTPFSAMVFNAAQHFVSAVLAGLVISSVLGAGSSALGSPSTVLLTVLEAIAFVLVMHAVNLALVSVYLKYREGISLVDAVRRIDPLADIPGNVLLALVGVVLASLIAAGSWVGAMLVLLPILAVRRVFRVYSELAAAYSDTIGALMGALEEKDLYTRGHSDRVASYCRLIGTEMKLASRDMALLERAALLHDIGKMAVPEHVLRSVRHLSRGEFETVRRHPETGEQILGGVELLEPLLPLIRRHHERLDGTGYPDGLTDIDIPLSVRILAVADAYDAMTSDRPYRPRLSEEQAMRELMRGVGTQFDAAVVQSLIAVLQNHASSLGDVMRSASSTRLPNQGS